MIAGGTDAGITSVMFAGLANMGALSANNDDPARRQPAVLGRPRRFRLRRGRGPVRGRVGRACAAPAARASTGRVAGGALTTDAFHISHPDPTGRQPRRAMRARAGAHRHRRPRTIDYICAHGTATRINDAVETSAIRDVFGAAADELLVSSPKSMVGHMIGAAGALSAMVGLLAMRDGVVPPTINLENPDPACDLDYVPLVAREATVAHRASSTRSASAARTASWC